MKSIVDLLDNNGGFGENMNKQIGGFVHGKVLDNNGSDFKGRVKVEYTTWEGALQDWLPVLTPYAGKDYGSYLIPEVGDIVIIGFIGNEMRVPFVLGSLYPADNSFQGECFDEKNLKRRLHTKGGIDISLSDEDGKQTVTVTTPGGLQLHMEDETQTVLLTDKEFKNGFAFDAQNGEINIEAEKKITIKTGSCEIIMDGQANKLSINCGTLEISASQKTSIDGGPTVEIKGTNMTVEGSAQTAVKGGILQLN